MFLNDTMSQKLGQTIPMTLIYQHENRYSLWVYSTILLMYDPYHEQVYTFRDIASYGNFFKSSKPSIKSLESIRKAVSYLVSHGYIDISTIGDVPFDGKINEVSFMCSIRPIKELPFDNNAFVIINCKEIGRLLEVAKMLNSSNAKCSMNTLMRVYYYLRRDSFFSNKHFEEECPGYTGVFTLAKKSLGLRSQNFSRILATMKYYEIITVRYGLRKIDGGDLISVGGILQAPAKTNAVMFNYLVDDNDKNDMLCRICSRVSELTNASYFWSSSNKENRDGFSTDPPLHARLLQG